MTKPAGPQAPRSGEVLGRWRLCGRAGRGSFGTVFRAELTAEPSTQAALKVARGPDDPRFAREAHLLATASSPHLPRLLDKGEWCSQDGFCYPYVVMQWVEGMPLYAVRNERALTNAFAARVLCHVARALAELHRLGGMHRDVKGDNILVSPEGDAVLVDLGASWHAGANPLTDTSIPPGTEAYRSPELLRFRRRYRRKPDAHYQSHPSDDLYALGVTAYRLVTGTYPAPLTDADTSSVEPPPFLSPSELATVSPELEKLILQVLSKDKEKRGSAAELAQSLEEVATRVGATPIEASPSVVDTEKTERPGPRRRPKAPAWLPWVSIGVGVGGILVLFGVVLYPPQPSRPWIAEGWEAHPPPSVTPDAGVGEEAVVSVVQAPRMPSAASVLGLPMPKAPLPGQKKPPCSKRSEREALGACWTVLKVDPPCEKEGYELDGLCVRASFDAPRQPTSEQP
ncbi:serine/threonine-protein kinase [Hyalangium rubrum]|uniref:Serine/threonine-protein kinase n=1 Tax=Hyalangium rubrum TaxID=3103134 RepID=A0ABU5H3Q5_9BACT|nr:serine/threonine-protein kinase [Hyalangium sp. s54d21]MDY7228095.1 serine/threonine-protein kinase [Hyalangium sp. s54d21]